MSCACGVILAGAMLVRGARGTLVGSATAGRPALVLVGRAALCDRGGLAALGFPTWLGLVPVLDRNAFLGDRKPLHTQLGGVEHALAGCA